MIVDMVTSHIQQNGDIRPEAADPLQLEAADLNHHVFLLLLAIDVTDQGTTNIASDEDLFPGPFQDFPDEGRCGRFAIGPGDGNHRPP
jgi:hypothetical protein